MVRSSLNADRDVPEIHWGGRNQEEYSLREAMGSDPIQGGERAPKTRIIRLTSENAGNATGRESYAFGTPIVVTGVTTRKASTGKQCTGRRGNLRNQARGHPLTKMSRVGVIELNGKEGARDA